MQVQTNSDLLPKYWVTTLLKIASSFLIQLPSMKFKYVATECAMYHCLHFQIVHVIYSQFSSLTDC